MGPRFQPTAWPLAGAQGVFLNERHPPHLIPCDVITYVSGSCCSGLIGQFFAVDGGRGGGLNMEGGYTGSPPSFLPSGGATILTTAASRKSAVLSGRWTDSTCLLLRRCQSSCFQKPRCGKTSSELPCPPGPTAPSARGGAEPLRPPWARECARQSRPRPPPCAVLG